MCFASHFCALGACQLLASCFAVAVLRASSFISNQTPSETICNCLQQLRNRSTKLVCELSLRAAFVQALAGKRKRSETEANSRLLHLLRDSRTIPVFGFRLCAKFAKVAFFEARETASSHSRLNCCAQNFDSISALIEPRLLRRKAKMKAERRASCRATRELSCLLCTRLQLQVTRSATSELMFALLPL